MVNAPQNHAKRRASVCTLGCRLNQSETQLIQSKLEHEGFEIVPFGTPAELGIINTCTVTHQADQKCRQTIRSFIRKNPGAYTAVVGCYSQLGYQAISEIQGVDLIIGNQAKLDVMDYVRLGRNERPLVVRDNIVRKDFAIDFEDSGDVTRRANLKIQDGCNFMCSFCVIPFARGRARSRDLENLLAEARSLVERGAREVVLTGVNIGTYDLDGHDICSVVEHLDRLPGLDRVRISSIEPTTIPAELFDVMRDPDHALLPYLHIPLQSGSDRVLERMKRRYTVAEYLDFLERADASVPDLCIGTDILVGSPGETEGDFDRSCDVLMKSPISYAHMFTYSERDGTPASRAGDHVPVPVRQQRNAVLRRLSARKRHAFDSSYEGRIATVLFEEARDGCWPGYTDNYIRVAVTSAEPLHNTIRKVRLLKRTADFVVAELAA